MLVCSPTTSSGAFIDEFSVTFVNYGSIMLNTSAVQEPGYLDISR